MQDPPTTKELIARAQDGNRAAIEALFAKSYPDVLQAVRFRLGPALRRRLDTMDVAQSAYHEAFRGLPRYDYQGKGSFRRWLMGIIENKIRRRLQFHKAQRRDMRREVGIGESEYPADEVSPTRHFADMEDRTCLERAMDALSDDYRDVIIGHYFLGLSWREVGERAGGRTPEAAQMHCRRALVKLKELYRRAP